VLQTLKRLVIGKPLASSAEGEQRLGKPVALAVFASDAISSTAYATEEILLVLMPVAALAALEDLVPIAIVVVLLLAIVVTSYRQTIKAYPNGGGAYIVAQDNLGEAPALLAGASLLVDYTLTVAVSVSAGVAAITSAFPELREYRVWMCLGFIALLATANLRGLKEAGRTFALPTYVYLVSLGLLLAVGLTRSFMGDIDPVTNQHALDELTQDGALLTGITVLLLLRAFSSGAVALSGVEAISNGVPAFRPPESRNAATTLTLMAVILGTYFFGISVLAQRLKPVPTEDGETVLSILGAGVFGDGSPMYFILQFATFAILILAANTAYTGFPLLSSLVARDGYLPRQLANRGDRLVFSNGILVLSAAAGALIVAFGGITTALIPLYAVGVFAGFTISQVGMVERHRKLRQPGWQRSAAVNVVGAIATFVVLLVVIVSKFAIGAWIPVIVIPAVAVVLWAIHRHYARVAAELRIPDGFHARRKPHSVVLLVGNLHRGVLEAVAYCRSLSPERLIAVTVVADEEEQEAALERWAKYDVPVDLRVIFSPYRELTRPVLRFIDEHDEEFPDDVLTVVLPEFVFPHWWQEALHNQSALVLKARLRMRPNTVVTNVPIHIFAGGPRDEYLEETGPVE
jgi:amino acid transporter